MQKVYAIDGIVRVVHSDVDPVIRDEAKKQELKKKHA
jgi:hypothetical protein